MARRKHEFRPDKIRTDLLGKLYLTPQQRRRLLELTKAFPVEIAGTRPVAEAIITAGGIKTKEVDPKTMESKLVSGLYFAGEILDVDAYTGGFNLQIAWSTGYAAGLAAGERNFEEEDHA